MKATIDIPDELYRQVKAKSALEGRAIREVATELFVGYVEGSASSSDSASRASGEATSAAVGPAPQWLGPARQYLRKNAMCHDWEDIAASVAVGWAAEVAEPAPRSRRKP